MKPRGHLDWTRYRFVILMAGRDCDAEGPGP